MLTALLAGLLLALSPDAGVVPPPPAAVDAGLPATTPAASFPADHRPRLDLRVAPQQAAVGDLVTWTLTVRRRVGDRLHLDKGAAFGGLEIQGSEIKTGTADGDWVEEVFTVRLVGFDPGDLEIPPQKLTVVDAAGHLLELETAPARVRVQSLIANEPEPKPRKDQGPGVPVFEEDYTLLWILGGLGAVLAIIGLTLLGRWLWARRKPRPGPPPPPPRPAEEIAREKLAALRASDLLERGAHEEFHVRLSETVREYVGRRYGFDSLELATEELVRELGQRHLEHESFRALVDLLNDTDLVKFARFVPAVDESRRLLDQACAVVERTAPRPAGAELPPGGDHA